MTTGREMPRYKSVREVWALKIAALEIHQDGSATIAPEDREYDPLETPPKWAERFEGDEDDLGYYVVYNKGSFTSWLPTKTFEEGHIET